MGKSSIRYYPIALFSSVMGFAAVTIAVRQIENIYNVNHLLSSLLLSLSTLWFFYNIGILLLRFIQYRENVNMEFNHPVKMNFFSAISISLLLLATSYINIFHSLSFLLWVVGAFTQISLTVIFLNKLMWNSSLKIEHFTPVSFIPIVGNLVVPIAGSFHVSAHINWFFFGVGILFSIVYMALIFYRLFFHAPLPGKIVPTLFILLAPPSVGYVAYVNIVGEVDVFAHVLYGIAFFIGLFLISQLKLIFTVPFSVPAWALLFPTSAFTIATIIMYRETGIDLYEWIYFILMVSIAFLVLYLSMKTIQLARNGNLCSPEN